MMNFKSTVITSLKHYRKYFFYKALQNTSRLNYVNNYGAVFLHIPKAAGTSVYLTLFGTLGGGHMTAENYKIMLNSSKYDAYFKFTFVRNPYDRVVSAYNFLKKGGMCSGDKKFFEDYMAQYENFDDFVINGLNKKEEIQKAIHFIPQYKFLTINGKIKDIFIGRFENIEQDYKYISNVLGINKELKKINSSRSNTNYREAYLEEETKNIIKKIYAKDLELFDYVF